jgi:Salmonella virulence plasmid 65kDa B protein
VTQPPEASRGSEARSPRESMARGADAGSRSGNTVGTPGSQQAHIPTISLPSGGGAIRGIDEKVSVTLATGTASLGVTVPTTACRHGFGADLTLSYDSGSGNGPFGLGWRLGVPAITRKTSRGLPRYEDDDVMLLSDTEDLVSALLADGVTPDRYTADGYTVQRYGPRVEQAFTRVPYVSGSGEASGSEQIRRLM